MDLQLCKTKHGKKSDFDWQTPELKSTWWLEWTPLIVYVAIAIRTRDKVSVRANSLRSMWVRMVVAIGNRDDTNLFLS